ncbi:MAG: TolC family protein [Pseudomonadota bacterium]
MTRYTVRQRSLLAVGLALGTAACSINPEPLTTPELNEIAKDRSERVIQATQEPISGKIDLYEAMARAIKYNLDNQVEIRDAALRFNEFQLSEFDMLPDLVASADWSNRSNDPFTTSISTSGLASVEPTRSTESEVLEADLTLSWDVLDFGLSYYRAKQQGDEFLIAQEQRRSTINRIIEDVRTAYWRAVAADRLSGRINRLEARTNRALANARAQVASGEGDRLEALEYQRELMGILRSTQELQRDLGVAKNQLAALMNVPQNQHYHVVIPRHANLVTPITRLSSEQMTKIAFLNRPELREISYRLRINEQEERTAVLELLPSLRGFLGLNYSSNEFLENGTWSSWGARLSWDLMNLARYPQRKKTVQAADDLLDARALALTQAVATQVYVANQRFHSLKKERRTALEYHNLSDQIFSQTRNEFDSGISTERDLVREDLNAVLASLRFDNTYAEMQSAFANVYAAVGLDAFDGKMTGNESVDELAASLRSLWAERGDRG